MGIPEVLDTCNVKLFINTIWKLELKKLVLTKCLYMAVNLIEKHLCGGYQLISFFLNDSSLF